MSELPSFLPGTAMRPSRDEETDRLQAQRRRLQIERDELNLYRQYCEAYATSERLTFEEFITSEEPANYSVTAFPSSWER